MNMIRLAVEYKFGLRWIARQVDGRVNSFSPLIRSIALAVFSAVPMLVASQPAPLTPIISIVPDVDVPNRSRTIVITGQTLANCPFASPNIDGQASQLIGGVVIRMDPVQTLVPCNTNAFSPYRFELAYTPIAAGAERVVVASVSGQVRSESRIRTAVSQGRARAVGDVTGIWYDRTTDGSGLQFTHNFIGSDFVFGTGYFYDRPGLARWLSIQNVVWQSGGNVFTGDLLETRAAGGPISCTPVPCLDVVAPRSAVNMTAIGTVRITFTGLAPYSDTGPQAVLEAFSNTGSVLFTMNLVRIAI